MSWPKVTLVECPRGHAMVLEDGFCEHCAESDMEREPVSCPDCGVGYIERGSTCTACSLSWEALEDAAAFLRKT